MSPMLRITLVSRTSEEEIYALEGWVSGEGVSVLEQTCGPALERGLRLVLDLGGVRSIDDTGLDLLKGWCGQRLVLRRPSAYIRQVLGNRGIPCGSDEDGTQ
jgi:hypothetical protein